MASILVTLLGLLSFTTFGLAQDENETPPADAEAAAAKAKAEAWLEGKALADKHAGKEDDDPYKIDSFLKDGDTAWMIVATALVLFMTIPGLSLFYGGLARNKNVLSVLVQCFAITSVMTLLWLAYGYSLASQEGEGATAPYFGDMGKAFLAGSDENAVGVDTVSGSIPESVFFTFQMTFAIITPALIVGAFAERMKFSAVLIFMTIWFTISYIPIWHMAWGGGLFGGGEEGNWLMGIDEEVWDFAGGTVVHINAGIAGLVACILVGKRTGFGSEKMTPHSVPLTLVGASMLWVGWFGFNAGSELAADGTAGMALLVTQVATAAAATTWMFVEWKVRGKPTAVGIATGAVAGLVAITPASGTAGPIGALIIGVAAGAICYWGATSLKAKFGYDDSLDVFGVHGIGGIVGAILTGWCAHESLGGSEGSFEVGAQMWVQTKSVLLTIVWSGAAAWIALKIADALAGGIRSDEDSEQQGLDLSDHGEAGYSS